MTTTQIFNMSSTNTTLEHLGDDISNWLFYEQSISELDHVVKLILNMTATMEYDPPIIEDRLVEKDGVLVEIRHFQYRRELITTRTIEQLQPQKFGSLNITSQDFSRVSENITRAIKGASSFNVSLEITTYDQSNNTLGNRTFTIRYP